jgi:1-deoxy-D-xylulose-5-phosphate reductoisomerase
LILLGSTGSIGVNALNIAREFKLNVEVLVAGNNIELLNEQIKEFNPSCVIVSKKELLPRVKHSRVDFGEEGIIRAIKSSKSPLVVNALVGFLGLRPTVEALKCGKRVALANKESLVAAGKFINTKMITPIDSEHFALWYLLQDKKIDKMTITASGGSFRDTPLDRLGSVSVEDALKHPNWSMGKKITIDSATMTNKLFELLEARWLFECERFDAIIETKSIIHAFIDFKDGSTTAHFAYADMRLPIAYALLSRVDKRVLEPVDLTRIGSLEFRKIDPARYPIWQIKDELLLSPERGVVVNAANEVAIEMFLKREIGFMDIAKISISAFKEFKDCNPKNIDEVFEIDKEVRKFAAKRFFG